MHRLSLGSPVWAPGCGLGGEIKLLVISSARAIGIWPMTEDLVPVPCLLVLVSSLAFPSLKQQGPIASHRTSSSYDGLLKGTVPGCQSISLQSGANS